MKWKATPTFILGNFSFESIWKCSFFFRVFSFGDIEKFACNIPLKCCKWLDLQVRNSHLVEYVRIHIQFGLWDGFLSYNLFQNIRHRWFRNWDHRQSYHIWNFRCLHPRWYIETRSYQCFARIYQRRFRSSCKRCRRYDWRRRRNVLR